VDYRTTNGPFKILEDLLKVPGVGPSTLEQIRGLVVIG
jgi:competence protein ComEA